MAGACGCTEACNCVLQGINGITVSGSGQSYDPYVIGPPAETPFAAVNTDGAVTITPGGAYGHGPVFNLLLDPASNAILSTSVSGLRVDIPPSGGGGYLPLGVAVPYGGDAPPSADLLFCEGQSLAANIYDDLFLVLGYKFGGAGASFNIPDLRGRPVIGPGSDATVNNVGDNDGFALASRLQSHLHADGTLAAALNTTGASIPGSTNAANGTNTGFGAGYNAADWNAVTDPHNGAGNRVDVLDATPGTHGHTINPLSDPGHGHDVSGSTGSTGTPFLVMNWMMRVL